MATKTTLPDGKTQDDHNPGQDEFDKIIEQGFGHGEEQAMEERAKDGAIDDYLDKKQTGRKNGPEPTEPQPEPEPDTASSDEQQRITQHENQAGRGYRPNREHANTNKRRGFLRINRRQALFGGGTAGLLVTLFMAFITTGPLEFIHIAQNLTQFHFSEMQDQSDDRVMRLARYVHYKNSGKVENTRLGFFQNKVANRLETRLNKSGIHTAYTDTFGLRDGYVVDPEKLANSELKELQGKSPEEIKVFLEEKFPGVEVRTNEIPGKIFIDTSSRDLSFKFGKNKVTTYLLKSTGMKTVASAEGARIMGKRAGVAWHPMSVIKNKGLRAAEKILAWRRERTKVIQEGAITDVTAKNGVDGTKDPQGAADAQSAADSANQIAQDGQTANEELLKGNEQAYENVKSSLNSKLMARGFLATGVLCVLKGIDDKSDYLKLSQVILPVQRMGMEMVTVGNQTMSGQDLDLETLGYYKSLLNGNGTSWVQAESIQAEMGRQGGVKPNKTLTTINKDSPFHPLNEGVVGTALGVACGTIGTGVQIVIGIFTGGITSTIISSAVSAIAASAVIDEAAHWLAGAAINPNAVGAEFGNIINYGARLAANMQALTSGGRILTALESKSLSIDQQQKSQEEFQSHGLAYKLFNPYDSRTVTSQIIDQQNPNVGQNVTRLATGMFNFKNAFASLPKLFTSKAHAATDTQYDYGFPQYGFSAAEMNSAEVKNPYKNANDVVNTILPAHQDFIDRADKCFGITIDPTSYDVTSFGTTAIDSANPDPNKQNFYTDKDSDCNDKSTEWLKTRFYIFDTQNMESLACYIGDSDDSETQEACKDIGFDEASVQAASTGSGGGTAVSGNSQELAKKILANNNIDLSCYSSSVAQDVQAAADGRPGTAGAPISSAILSLIATVGQKHKVCVTAIESNGGGHSDNSLHYSGDAVDFGNLDGQTLTGRDSGSITIIKIAYDVLPNGSSIGQSQCGSTPPAPKGWAPTFEDSCNHLHIQVPRDTP